MGKKIGDDFTLNIRGEDTKFIIKAIEVIPKDQLSKLIIKIIYSL